MDLFELNQRQLMLLAVAIADGISNEYTVEELEIIATVLSAIVENISIGLAVAGKLEAAQIVTNKV